MPEENSRVIDLKEILLCIWSNKLPIAIITIAFGVISLLITTFCIHPKYEATIRLYVNNTTESTKTVNSSDISAAQSLVNTYIAIIQSESSINDVMKAAEVDYTVPQMEKMISASAVNGTEVFSVSVTSESPEESAKIANTIANIAPEKIAAIVEGSSVRVIDFANVPSDPVSPSIYKNTVIVAIIGFIFSCILFIVLYLLDTTINTESDIKEFSSLPILGIISNFEEHRSGKYGYSRHRYDYYARKAKDE